MQAWEEEIRSLYSGGEYGRALDRLNELAVTDADNPRVFLWKGRCLQLVQQAKGSLSEIEDCFAQALTIDDSFTSAILELAWFYLNVLDDANRALGVFEKAIEVERDIATEAIEGKARCLAETQGKQAARDFLFDASNHVMNMSTIKELIQENDE